MLGGVTPVSDLPGTSGELGRELVTAIELARAAGALVMRVRDGGDLDVEMKTGNEPVTIADKRASELIVAGIAAAFPGDPVISEELAPAPGAMGSQRLWLIDPIDGTKDFIRGSEGFSVMIGIVRDDRAVLGVVHQPAVAPSGRTFFATPEGAWVATADGVQPLHVSAVATAGEIRLVASASHRSDDIDRVKATLGIDNELNIGSVGVKLSLIAMGVRDLYVNPWPKTKAWDSCAPQAILERAGGRLTDLFGGRISYTGELRHTKGLVASNGLVHDDVVARLAPLFSHLRA
jgi:3'(2'), 5'-bisphosphate nucleotidase